MTVQPSRSPVRLRNYQLAGTAAVLLFALITIGQLLQLRSDLAGRPQLTTQGVRATQLEAELARAGRIAAMTALGADDTAQLDTSLATSADLVVKAAAAGANADQLAGINASLGTYGHLLRQAAATTDDTASAELLIEADAVLSGTLQPALETLGTSVSQQAGATVWLAWALGIGGVAVLGVLVWGWVQSARLSHRALNPGLAAAAALTIGITVLAVNMAGGAGAASTTDALQQAAGLARIQIGTDTSAKLQAEAVLGKRFTAEVAKAEKAARQLATKSVNNTTPDDVRRASSSAVDRLGDSAAMLEKASWTPATAVLLGTDGTNLPKYLTALASTAGTASEELVESTQAAPTSEATGLIVATIGVGLMAAAAAVAVIWGIGLRLKEYQ